MHVAAAIVRGSFARTISSSVMRVFTSVPAPCEQLWMTPFMSRYRLSMIGTFPASHE